MGKKRESTYKQLAFDTAVRNPERYKDILSSIVDFDGRNLDDACLLDVLKNMYKNKIVTSAKIDICKNLSDEELKNKIKTVNLTRNADGGFPKGYQSRFWTYMRTLSEFGFVYARYNKPLKLSDVTKALIENKIDEQEAFSIQSMKYNRKSPYRNVSNDFNYFKFIIKVLLKLKEQNKGLSYYELILSMYNKEGNVNKFLSEITINNFNNETALYEYIKEKYHDVNKIKTIFKDYPDVIIRVLRITGFITIKSKGLLYFYINENKVDYIKELINIVFSYTEEEKFDDLKYFEKNNDSDINNQLLSLVRKYQEKEQKEFDVVTYSKKIKDVIDVFEIEEDEIITLINNLQRSNKEPRIKEFKYIPEPLKLEFYISILIYMKYGNEFIINPNYKIDSIGIPISHAPGNKGDIEVYNKEKYWLIEVTLIRNKAQQQNNETTTTIRHLKIIKHNKKYLSFVAPYVHDDTENYYKYSLVSENNDKKNMVYLKSYNIEEFLEITKQKLNLENMELYTKETFKEFSKNVNSFN